MRHNVPLGQLSTPAGTVTCFMDERAEKAESQVNTSVTFMPGTQNVVRLQVNRSGVNL